MRIGKGGQSIVYKAQNTESGETVAIKQFSMDENVKTEKAEEFYVRAKREERKVPNFRINRLGGNKKAEMRTIQKLNHPNIIKYIDHIEMKGKQFLILE